MGEYKEQWRVENRFRFLKQPVMLGPVFVKKKSRIRALGYIFLLALLVATYIEYRIRTQLAKRQEKILNLAGNPEQKPTFKTIREVLEFLEIRITPSDTGIVRKDYPGDTPTLGRIIEATGFHPAIYTEQYQKKWDLWSTA